MHIINPPDVRVFLDTGTAGMKSSRSAVPGEFFRPN